MATTILTPINRSVLRGYIRMIKTFHKDVPNSLVYSQLKFVFLRKHWVGKVNEMCRLWNTLPVNLRKQYEKDWEKWTNNKVIESINAYNKKNKA